MNDEFADQALFSSASDSEEVAAPTTAVAMATTIDTSQGITAVATLDAVAQQLQLSSVPRALP